MFFVRSLFFPFIMKRNTHSQIWQSDLLLLMRSQWNERKKMRRTNEMRLLFGRFFLPFCTAKYWKWCRNKCRHHHHHRHRCQTKMATDNQWKLFWLSHLCYRTNKRNEANVPQTFRCFLVHLCIESFFRFDSRVRNRNLTIEMDRKRNEKWAHKNIFYILIVAKAKFQCVRGHKMCIEDVFLSTREFLVQKPNIFFFFLPK